MGREVSQDMNMVDEHDNGALRAAFQAALDAKPEPALPSVADAAVAGGRRIRRRRAALVMVGALTVSACALTAVVSLSGAGDKTAPMPVTPADTTRPRASATPHPAASASAQGLPDPQRTAGSIAPDTAAHRP